MAVYEGEVVVKSGTFLYDETIIYDLRIVRTKVRPGSTRATLRLVQRAPDHSSGDSKAGGGLQH